MKILKSTIVVLGTLFYLSAFASGHEHGGKEHGGKEHGGKEHGGHSHHHRKYSALDIKASMRDYIKKRTKSETFTIADKDKNKHASGKTLKLQFVKIHDPVRKIEGQGYFACTDFKIVGDKSGKLYDLDFWLKPDKDGSLKVYKEKIHKHPAQKAGKWVKKARYTFINDKPSIVD